MAECWTSAAHSTRTSRDFILALVAAFHILKLSLAEVDVNLDGQRMDEASNKIRRQESSYIAATRLFAVDGHLAVQHIVLFSMY